jgi:hypothetical protein
MYLAVRYIYVLDPRLQDAKKIPKWSMRSRRGIYHGVSKHHSSTVHLVLSQETGAISPQYHCIFDDTFSTIWSDGQFDPLIWQNLVEQVESHFSLTPDSTGNINLPPDFVPFSQDIPNHSKEILHRRQQDVAPRSFGHIENKTNINNNNNQVSQSNTGSSHESPSSPIVSRRIFGSPSPTSFGDITSKNTDNEPCCLARSNLGQAPTILDPSNHLATNYTKSSSITPSKHYCNVFGLKLPSAIRGRKTSQ